MTTRRSIRIRTIALLGGGVVAGVIGASALGASAQTTTGTGSTASTSTTSTSSGTSSSGTAAKGSETTVTGAKAVTLKANALKQVPGATVESITTEDSSDPSGAAYEVHVTKADGTRATLLFDANLKYLSTQTGGGHDGHGGDRGGHGGGAGETTVTGANAATLKAAALAKVPGATVDEVSTDSGDAAYEVHLTKADGTEVTVKFDKSLKFVAIESGRGK